MKHYVQKAYTYVCTTAIVVCAMVAYVYMREYALTHGEWGRVTMLPLYTIMFYVLYRVVRSR